MRSLLWLGLFGCLKPPEAAPLPPPTPRLVVFVIVDQFPTRLLDRAKTLATGGFSRLTGPAAWQATARHQHSVTFTCPGHATLSTGTSPSAHGIPSNDWLIDGKPTYCANLDFLRTEPVADVFHEAGGSVVSLSLKDRGAILLGGHYPAAVVYFDKKAGRFTPPFENVDLSKYSTTEWVPLFPEKYAQWFPDDQAFEADPAGRGERTFPHAPLGDKFPGSFLARPEAGTALTEAAIASIDRYSLGADETPDLLTISYSEVDYIGHSFTSDSWEAVDSVLRLDQDLGLLFATLDAKIGAEKYTVVLSSDHGAAPYTSKRINQADLTTAANAALRAQGITGDVLIEDPGVWLPPSLLQEKRLDALKAVAEALEAVPGIARAVPWRDQPASDDAIDRAVRLSVDSERSGDLYLVRDPDALYNYPGAEGLGTSHGTPYDYDQLVPWLMVGAGIHGQVLSVEQDTRSIAPTIANIAGLRSPKDTPNIAVNPR